MKEFLEPLPGQYDILMKAVRNSVCSKWVMQSAIGENISRSRFERYLFASQEIIYGRINSILFDPLMSIGKSYSPKLDSRSTTFVYYQLLLVNALC